MRQDQYEKLSALTEKLMDVVVAEIDCDKWPGAKIPVDMQDKTIRGDRYWCKKNAVATVALVIRLSNLTDIACKHSALGSGAAAVQEDEDELDNEIKNAEKAANALMKKLTDKNAKKHFDEKVHGKT